MFDEGHIKVMLSTRNCSTEKIETIIRRNITTTRMRDFYDIYILYKIYKNKIDLNSYHKLYEHL